MTEYYIDKLKLLINCEIKDRSNLSKEEIDIRERNFYQNFSLNNYKSLFTNLNIFFRNEKVNLIDKRYVLELLTTFLNKFTSFSNDNYELPINIKNLYSASIEFNNLNILYENLSIYKVPQRIDYELLILDFVDFINNDKFKLYNLINLEAIHNFQTKLLNYLNLYDEENHQFKDTIKDNFIIDELRDLELSKQR